MQLKIIWFRNKKSNNRQLYMSIITFFLFLNLEKSYDLGHFTELGLIGYHKYCGIKFGK